MKKIILLILIILFPATIYGEEIKYEVGNVYIGKQAQAAPAIKLNSGRAGNYKITLDTKDFPSGNKIFFRSGEISNEISNFSIEDKEITFTVEEDFAEPIIIDNITLTLDRSVASTNHSPLNILIESSSEDSVKFGNIKIPYINILPELDTKLTFEKINDTMAITVINNVSYVSLRDLTNNFGTKITWDNEKKAVSTYSISGKNDFIVDNNYYTNNYGVDLPFKEGSVLNIDNSIYIPLYIALELF
ncbi:MAG: stalk domain-containing protein [Lachnospirales bacterium]